MNCRGPSYTPRRGFLNRIVGGLLGLAGAAAWPRRDFAVANTDFPGPPPPVAGLAACGSFRVTAAIDGDTLDLADGSRLRLGNIEAPKDLAADGDAEMAALAREARLELARLATGRSLRLYCDRAASDRHRRRVAQAVDADGNWLQAEMVKRGLARVHGQADHRLGLRELLPIEAAARDAGSGLWRLPAFAVRRAAAPDLSRLSGSFQIVAGRVLAAERHGALGFVNFGPDRHADLTLVLKKDALKLFDASNIAIEGLRDREIRCRGWLTAFNGPNIEITHPEQIEILES